MSRSVQVQAYHPSYKRGTSAGKSDVRFFGILSSVLATICSLVSTNDGIASRPLLILSFYEIYKHGVVLASRSPYWTPKWPSAVSAAPFQSFPLSSNINSTSLPSRRPSWFVLRLPRLVSCEDFSPMSILTASACVIRIGSGWSCARARSGL